jgi:hypothetical protein
MVKFVDEKGEISQFSNLSRYIRNLRRKKKTENLIYRAAAVLDGRSTRLTRVATTLVRVAGTMNISGLSTI